MAEMIRIHLHCDNIYDNIPDSERFVPYEEGIHLFLHCKIIDLV